MEIQQRTSDSILILDLSGDLTLGPGEAKLRALVEQLTANNRVSLLINLAAVERIDSSGIGALIKSLSSAKKGGGKLKLLRPSRLALQLLGITGLTSVFEIFDDEAKAISSF